MGSLGQRQLICMARTLLRVMPGSKAPPCKVMLLDEATASVGTRTDQQLQETFRFLFDRSTCTVLAIAHRINTIHDSDRILVLDHGQVAEFDTPDRLLQDPESLYAQLHRE